MLDSNLDVLSQIFNMGFTSLAYLKVLVDASGGFDGVVEDIFQYRCKNFGWEESSV